MLKQMQKKTCHLGEQEPLGLSNCIGEEGLNLQWMLEKKGHFGPAKMFAWFQSYYYIPSLQ